MIRCLFVLFALIGAPVAAETVVPAHTLRARTVITAGDLLSQDGSISGAAQELAQVIGMEAKVALYAGRPILLSDIGPPALIMRNQLVTLNYTRGGLTIRAEARALGRAGAGEHVQVMNLSSRATLHALVLPDGSLKIDQ